MWTREKSAQSNGGATVVGTALPKLLWHAPKSKATRRELDEKTTVQPEHRRPNNCFTLRFFNVDPAHGAVGVQAKECREGSQRKIPRDICQISSRCAGPHGHRRHSRSRAGEMCDVSPLHGLDGIVSVVLIKLAQCLPRLLGASVVGAVDMDHWGRN